jgi:hypothetical protein
MNDFKFSVARLVLAICLSMSASMAAAGPNYHVNIDTSALGSGPAYLGLSFLSLADGTGAGAMVTNLIGDLVGSPSATGAVSGSAPGPIVFTNAGGGGDLVQAITLGGGFSFDVAVALGNGVDGTTFSWAIFDDTHYLGIDGDLGSIFLLPGAAPAGQVTFTPANEFSEASAVPEPSSVALFLIAALCLMATARRSRQH